jgi:hypothetical protein
VTGLPLGELLALKWLNLSFEQRQLTVTRSLWRKKVVSPKTKSMRIPAALVAMLEEYCARSK